MAAPLDSFIQQLQHRVWTQFIPLLIFGLVAGVLFRFGAEKLGGAIARLLRGKPRNVKDRDRPENERR